MPGRTRNFLAALLLPVLAAPLPLFAQSTPNVAAVFIGPEEVVADYDTPAQQCDPTDTPDEPARAFRDDRNVVHLVASISNSRAMIGRTLDTVAKDCHVIHASPEDTNPQDFSDNHWPMSFYTSDGRNIAALVHSEYDGFMIVDACSTRSLNASYANCWWNTITYAVSTDGGANFREPPPPDNLVAAPPYPYNRNNLQGPDGYNGPTNIVKWGDYYYALINDWPYRDQQYGPCLIRTANIFDPHTWRAWDGKDFTIQFANPYVDQNIDPAKHVCPPVFAGSAQGLLRDKATGLFITEDYDPGSSYGPTPGVYVWVSADLVHWSRAYGVGHMPGSESYFPATQGRYTYGYFDILDPSSSDRSFSTSTATPYMYYVRFDGNNPPYARTLLRRQIRLTISNPQ